jgi:hypothetical protein
MLEKLKTSVYGLLIAAGVCSFALQGNSLQPLPAGLAILFIAAALFYRFKRQDRRMEGILLPFAAGLLVWIVRLFYWDRFDLAERVNNLLLLSLLFSLFLLVRKFRLLPRLAGFFNGLSLKKRLILIVVVLESIFIFTSVVLTHKQVTLVGDEPHYMIIAQSIARDFDLNVANQYYQKQYREFLAIDSLGIHGYYGKWDPHFEGPKPGDAETRQKKKDSYIYSIHLPGISFTLAPFLLLKLTPTALYILTRCFLGLFAAALGVLVYLISLKLWNRPNLSLFILVVFSLTSPVFFYSSHIYPELQVLLLVTAALYLLLFSQKRGNWTVLLAGFSLSLLLFWGVKYAIFMYLFTAGFFVYFLVKRQYKRAMLLIVFPLVSQALFLLYLYTAYGNLSPMSVYMNEGQKKNFWVMISRVITLKMRVEALLDYLFDQKDGLLLYNPFYFFAFPGLILALKRFKKYWVHLLISIPAALFVLSYAFMTHRGGYCPQARPLVPVVWALLLLGVIYVVESRNELFKKIYYYVPLYSLFVVAYQIFHPLTIYQSTTTRSLHRAGLLFQQWSNFHIYLPDFLSSFVKVGTNHRYLPNIVILALFAALVVIALLPLKKIRLGALFPVAFAILFALFVLFPRVPTYNPTLVERDGVIAHRIYGVGTFPTRMAERPFTCTRPGTYRYTISTFTPAPYFVFEYENQSDTPVTAALSNFDRSLRTDTLTPQKNHQWIIPAPQHNQINSLYYYQFTLDIRPPTTQSLSLTFQLYPTRRLP